jgi:hypothetical protein
MSSLPPYVFRSGRTKEINHQLKQLCDIDHPHRLEGHSLHAVAAQQRHFVIAPAISGGMLNPCHHICIWSVLPGQNLLWNCEVSRDVQCNLFSCYFPSQFTGMQFIMAGSYGSAYRAVWNRGDDSAPVRVVIKRIDLTSINTRDVSSLILVMREKMLLQRLHHEHISSIIMQYNDPNNADILYFVLEDGGPSTLDNLLRDSIHTQLALSPSNVQIIMTHVCLF